MKVTVTFDWNDLPRCTDQYLMLAWHMSQANPAPYGDKDAGQFTEHVAREIVRRWLRTVEPELWHHQGSHHDNQNLTRLAKFDGETWVPKTPGDAPDAVHRADGYRLDAPAKCGRRTGTVSHSPDKVTCPDCLTHGAETATTT